MSLSRTSTDSLNSLKIDAQQIGFDFDGVIADIGEAFLRLACERFGYCSIKLEEITSFQVETCTSIPEHVVRSIFSDILEDSLATGLLPIPGSLETISALTGQAKVSIITARTLAAPVADWLDSHLDRDVFDNINIYAMGDHDNKVRYLQQLNLRCLVDDRAETCAQVAEAGLKPLLYRQPWNHSWNNFSTVNNWQEIANILQF